MTQALQITPNTTKKSLVDHANEHLGVKLDINIGRNELIQQFREAERSLGIMTEIKEQGSDLDSSKSDQPNNGNPKKARITIHQPPSRNADEGEEEEETHCIVGFNGRNFQIGYEKEVTVPWGVYDILTNAVQIRYRKEFNKDAGKKVLVPYSRKRYTVSLLEKLY